MRRRRGARRGRLILKCVSEYDVSDLDLDLKVFADVLGRRLGRIGNGLLDNPYDEVKVNCLSKSWQTLKKRTRLAPIMIDRRNNTSQRSTCPIRTRKPSKRDAFEALSAATELVIDKGAKFALPAMHYVQWFKHGLKPHSCFHRSSEVSLHFLREITRSASLHHGI